MSGWLEDEFYWCKVRYDNDHIEEPLIRLEVLHYEDGRWWAAAHEGPFLEDNILEVGQHLERPQ